MSDHDDAPDPIGDEENDPHTQEAPAVQPVAPEAKAGGHQIGLALELEQ